MNRFPFNNEKCRPALSPSGRRDFMKTALVLGGAALVYRRPLWSEPGKAKFTYKYGTMSVSHLPEMQAFIDKLRDENKISRHPVFRNYIYPKNGGSGIPDNFKDAKSLIILAIAQPPLTVSFRHQGKVMTTALPPGYYDDGNTLEDYMKVVREEIVRDPKARIELAGHVYIKQAAVRCGLGTYGRNNICYVEGMGSFLALAPFLTNFEFPQDHWRKPTMLAECAQCDICYGICPTGAISRDNFVIDVGKCITLYNEIPGEFPNFILPSMHNSLMGCLKCQDRCPANAKHLASAIRLDDVLEDETRKILNGTPDDALLKSMAKKLKGFGASKEGFPVFTRNLKALMR